MIRKTWLLFLRIQIIPLNRENRLQFLDIVQKRYAIVSEQSMKVSRKWLQVPRPRLEITRKNFSYKGAKVLNDISTV